MLGVLYVIDVKRINLILNIESLTKNTLGLVIIASNVWRNSGSKMKQKHFII